MQPRSVRQHRTFNKRLRAFDKIFLKAGRKQTGQFTIDKNDLAFVNAQLKPSLSRRFWVQIGDACWKIYEKME